MQCEPSRRPSGLKVYGRNTTADRQASRAPTVLAASPGSAPNCTVNCTQHGTAAAICRSKGEPCLLYLTVAEARTVLMSESGLRHNGQVHFNAMSDAKKSIYRLMGPPFIFSRRFIPDVKQQVSPYVHRGMRATVQQVTTAHLCHL